jgi:UDP-3-O-[3-hydroxymyristoyl] N-acetylglucosamine deacetylase
MKLGKQTTVATSVELHGVGVHSGRPIKLSIQPAQANTGIVFCRNVPGEPEREIRAEPRSVAATAFATVLGDAKGPAVSTIEHVLAALHGLSIDNAVVVVDGPEVPIMDGSAAPFVEAIDAAGVKVLSAARRYLRVLKPIGVASGTAYGELRPYDHGFRVEVEIDFEHSLVGRQSFAFDLDPQSFRRQVAKARTFGFTRDVERLWGAGYALGASLENTIVLSDDRILNPEGLRFADEFVRHKTLDAIGDLALAGAPILGAYRSSCGGHRLNYAVLSALLADQSAWRMETANVPVAPTAQPVARRLRGHAGIGAMVQPAFAPDLS